jgi:flagella basal body P-ring formation protein FlgA
MKRTISTLIVLIMTSVAQAAAPTHNSVSIEGDYVTLGDLYPTAPESLTKTQVLIAPQPGNSITLNANWLGAVARKYSIDYVPQTNLDTIKLIGASDTIPNEEVEQILKEHISQIIKNEAFTIKLDNNELRLHFPKGKVGDIMVTSADLNTPQTRFQATLVLQYEGKELSRTKVNGRIQPMTLVPVLTRAIHRGETIQPEDIEWHNLPSHQVNQSTVMDEAALIGATPKRQDLIALRPLNKHDVSVPHMVLKNQSVIIYADSPTINLTAKGKALENGAKDAYVKIMNIDSQRIFHGTVIGPQQVRVEIPTMHTVLGTE